MWVQLQAATGTGNFFLQYNLTTIQLCLHFSTYVILILVEKTGPDLERITEEDNSKSTTLVTQGH